MTTSNHMLTGAILALTIKQPALVLPLALASHFLLDAVPHYGYNATSGDLRKRFRRHAAVEICGIVAIAVLIATGIYGLNLVLLASLVAVAPDAEWPIRYWRFHKTGKIPSRSVLGEFHKKIQRYERPWGIYIEIIYFAAGYLLLKQVILR